jgi:hypothetical protein
MLKATAASMAFLPRNMPMAAPAKAACDMVKPMDESAILEMMTPKMLQAMEAKIMASRAWQTTLFAIRGSSIEIHRIHVFPQIAVLSGLP